MINFIQLLILIISKLHQRSTTKMSSYIYAIPQACVEQKFGKVICKLYNKILLHCGRPHCLLTLGFEWPLNPLTKFNAIN